MLECSEDEKRWNISGDVPSGKVIWNPKMEV